jgi:SAM-dependent methyltransferase
VSDPVLDVDWAAQWMGLVEVRRAQGKGTDLTGFWDRRARRFALSMRGQVDPFAEFMAPWLTPNRTLIDVGAGTGRHATAFAPKLDWVTAVEPSQGMRDHLRVTDNMTVVASSWQDADVAPADLVICVHAMYALAEPVPFIHKLERSARERVFIVLRDSPHTHPAEIIAGPGRAREPRARDCFLLLRQMGVAPDLAMLRYPSFHRFENTEQVVDECRTQLGDRWDEAGGRAWLAANLRQDEDGSLVYEAGDTTSGVLHWKPR